MRKLAVFFLALGVILMAVLGRWTGGAKTQGNLPESWTAPTSLFDTQARNDGSAYTWTASTSTLTLPSSGLADGYLLIAYFDYHDASNGRFNPQGKIVQASGTGNFVGGPTGGYNRNSAEDRSYVRCWAFVDNPSASSTYQFQWKADTDDADASSGTQRSCFEVIPFHYADIGMYTSSDHTLMGGTTPNVVPGWGTTLEGTNITRSGNVITITGDNKRYLILASQFFEGRGGRTQRWHGLDIDGTQETRGMAYSYYRNTSNDENGDMFTWLLETVTASVTIEQTCYRGDGTNPGDGGASVDNSDPGVGDHTLVVIELNDSAEVFRSADGTGNQNYATIGPVDVPVARAGDIDFNDSDSFTRASDNAMNCEQAMDVLLGANVSASGNDPSNTSRWTAYAEFTKNGTEDTQTVAGDYMRYDHNSSWTAVTLGWSANLLSFMAVANGDDVGVSVTEKSGTAGGGGNVRANADWVGFWGINLDSLEGLTHYTVETNSGSYSLSGQILNPLNDRKIATTSDVYSISGQAVTVKHDKKIPTSAGNYSVSGQALNPLHDKKVGTNAGSYTLSGQAANLLRGFKAGIASGAYSISGQVVTVEHDKVIPINAGSFSLAGQAVNLSKGIILVIDAGSYALSGQAMELEKTYQIAMASGSYTMNGQIVNLLKDSIILIDSGSYVLSGQNMILLYAAASLAPTCPMSLIMTLGFQ